MDHVVAYSTLAMTVGLAVSRPRIGRGHWEITPGIAALLGVLVLLVAGMLRPDDLLAAAKLQWRPLLSLTCVMVMTGVVKEVGAFDRMAASIEAEARRAGTSRAFDLVFLASVLTAALLNNDAGIILLTPVVVTMARRLHPGRPRVVEAFAFAVFLAPGVAPFTISNPMNMVVAEVAGLSFNRYAAIMGPISLVGALLTYAILRLYYRQALRAEVGASALPPPPVQSPAERPALFLLLAVFLSYPVMATLGGPTWVVALLGALCSLLLLWAYDVVPLPQIRKHVSLDILAFLWGVFLVVAGLRTVGLTEHLSAFYAAHGQSLGLIGLTSALGSALVDNHPMSILNLMALQGQADHRPLLAALVGGDIGPRLLPIGSLAGLLWLELLRRSGLTVRTRRFMLLGTITLVPTLGASLLLLWWSA